jgi:hypothetical protein
MLASLAFDRAEATIPITILATKAMMATTTSSSIIVKPPDLFLFFLSIYSASILICIFWGNLLNTSFERLYFTLTGVLAFIMFLVIKTIAQRNIKIESTSRILFADLSSFAIRERNKKETMNP